MCIYGVPACRGGGSEEEVYPFIAPPDDGVYYAERGKPPIALEKPVSRLPWNKLQNSLLLRLGGMFATITVLAVASMSTSWMVAETTQGSGKAINLAGSLRMQSWRMASIYQRLLQDRKPEYRESLQQAVSQFDGDLKAGPILAVLPADETAPLKRVYREVESDWRTQIKP